MGVPCSLLTIDDGAPLPRQFVSNAQVLLGYGLSICDQCVCKVNLASAAWLLRTVPPNAVSHCDAEDDGVSL